MQEYDEISIEEDETGEFEIEDEDDTEAVTPDVVRSLIEGFSLGTQQDKFVLLQSCHEEGVSFASSNFQAYDREAVARLFTFMPNGKDKSSIVERMIKLFYLVQGNTRNGRKTAAYMNLSSYVSAVELKRQQLDEKQSSRLTKKAKKSPASTFTIKSFDSNLLPPGELSNCLLCSHANSVNYEISSIGIYNMILQYNFI